MINMILAVLLGLGIFVLNAWLLKGIIKRAESMPTRRTPRYLVTRYLSRLGVLLIIVAFLIWQFGLKFGLAALGGMILGQVTMFIVIGGLGKGASFPNGRQSG